MRIRQALRSIEPESGRSPGLPGDDRHLIESARAGVDPVRVRAGHQTTGFVRPVAVAAAVDGWPGIEAGAIDSSQQFPVPLLVRSTIERTGVRVVGADQMPGAMPQSAVQFGVDGTDRDHMRLVVHDDAVFGGQERAQQRWADLGVGDH